MKRIKKYQIPIISILIIIEIFLGYTLGKYTNTEADSTYQFQSSEISFNGSEIGLSATNVKDAVDQIYQLYKNNEGSCIEGYEKIETVTGYECKGANKHFISAYTYNASSCLSGNESGCVKTTCYTSKISGSCPVGTIIDYQVKEGETIRFHVLHDNGTTITLQTQQNTIYNTAWHSGVNDNTKGPTTIMNALKNATNDWINVNNIPITTNNGTTFPGVISIENSCNAYNSCSGFKYNFDTIEGTYKARMITMQEATSSSIGECTNREKSCKSFMNNYLTANSDYWTLDAYSSSINTAWVVTFFGYVNNCNVSSTSNGARAVVEVTK